MDYRIAPSVFPLMSFGLLMGCDPSPSASPRGGGIETGYSGSEPATSDPTTTESHPRRFGLCTVVDCGGPALDGSCWCDELCEGYGDCCSNKSDVCDLESCGGIADLPCSDHTECLDDPNDDCDPNDGGADCSGICVGFCGGVAGFGCDAGYVCVDDPDDDCDPDTGGADCPGVCMSGGDCDPYPILLEPSPAAQAAAEAELAIVSPGASITWNPEPGTFQTLGGLDVDLQGCSGTQNVFAALMPILANHPALFQLDLSEWVPSIARACGDVDSSSVDVRLNRASLGGQSVVGDFLTFNAVSNGQGQVSLASVFGSYLPVASTELASEMGACQSIDETAARGIALANSYEYLVFNQCAPMSMGTYVPNALDTVEIDTEVLWTWDEVPSMGGVRLQATIAGRLIIHPANITPDLIQSDTNCPVPGSATERIFGYELSFDAVTGEILAVKRGIGCTVC